MHHLLEMWFTWVLTGGYTGIIVLMAMESSIFPVPSEIVIPPAAFLAAQGKLSFTGRSSGGNARIVFGLGHHLLGVTINRQAADREIWTLRVADSEKAGTSGALACPL